MWFGKEIQKMLRKIIKAFILHPSAFSKEIILCLISAVLLIFSFPCANCGFLAWFGFIPLFLAIQNKSQIKAFILAYFTGVIFWLGTIYWLIHVTLAGMLLLVLYLALYFGIFGLIIHYITRYTLNITQVFFIPSIWVILEYLRSYMFILGFPWAILGYSQYLNLPVIQIADITGVFGVSFLVMMANVVVYEVMRYGLCVLRQKQKAPFFIVKWLLPVVILGLSLGYGFYKLRITHDAGRSALKVSVIQGNIPQELKWNDRYKNFIINRYLSLSIQAAKDSPDLIVWPEAALPVVLEEEPLFLEKIKSFNNKFNVPLVLGAVTTRDNLYYNSAVLISKEGRFLNRYDKLHLVPFGEYIPLKKILPFLETIVPIGEIERGRDWTVFELEDSFDSQSASRSASVPVNPLNRQTGKPKFSVLICFEDLFPELSREFIKRGADFLVNITNDAWYKKTSASYQHLQASVFRALENRVFLARASNTGISGFISPNGRIISLVHDQENKNIFISGYDTQNINPSDIKGSFYTRYGDIFIFVCLLFVLFVLFRVSGFRKPFAKA
ncbi:MAG: apolipoprotein N-acyltransferase [Candidatus Omnitrophota bacterium]